MRMALARLQIIPDYVLIDAMEPEFLAVEGAGIIRGDSRYLSIAAASIIAKVFRDNLIHSFARFFHGYVLEKNKGFPIKNHVSMVLLKGCTEFHRKSYKVKKWQQKID